MFEVNIPEIKSGDLVQYKNGTYLTSNRIFSISEIDGEKVYSIIAGDGSKIYKTRSDIEPVRNEFEYYILSDSFKELAKKHKSTEYGYWAIHHPGNPHGKIVRGQLIDVIHYALEKFYFKGYDYGQIKKTEIEDIGPKQKSPT